MYRVTNNMMVSKLLLDMQTNLRSITKYNEQLTSTRRINRPSDDPGGLVKSLRLRTNIKEAEQYQNNLNETVNFLNTTDSALDNLGQVLQRIRELTVNVSTGTNSDTDMKLIGDEIHELKAQLGMIANTAYGSKMVFAGRNVTESPYQDGKWTGNDELLLVEIGAANTSPFNITNADMNNFFTGDAVNFISDSFTFPRTAVNFTIEYEDLTGTSQTTTLTASPSSGQFENLQELMTALSVAIEQDPGLQGAGIKINLREQEGKVILSSGSTRLLSVEDDMNPGTYVTTPPFSIFNLVDKILNDINNGDNVACSADLDLIDSKIQDVLTSRSLVGARVNRLELQLSRLEGSEISYNDLLSKNEDTDMAEAIMKLKMQENVYQACLAVGAKVIQPTLVDYLR